jgi:hypothetical protein
MCRSHDVTEFSAPTGKAAAKTNMEKYGEDFYKRIGEIGGRRGRTGGFFANRELARTEGAKGGRISRRTKKPEVQSCEPPAAPGKRVLTDTHSQDVGGGFSFSR